MVGKAKRKAPELVYRDGKPAAVIIDIDEYQDLLERLDDVDDLKMLAEMRQKPLKFKKLAELLAEYKPDA
jgi:PHD/YefM family antitoxin component YafN of YafNO toxin-antitoxin module